MLLVTDHPRKFYDTDSFTGKHSHDYKVHFCFHSEEPRAVHHDFWRVFIFIFTFFGGILVQTTYSLLPGNNPSHFYICSGIIPNNYNQSKIKVNYGLLLLMLMTICVHVVLGIKTKLYNWTKGTPKALVNLANELKHEKYNIVTLTYQIIIALSFVIVLLPIFKVVSMNLTSF